MYRIETNTDVFYCKSYILKNDIYYFKGVIKLSESTGNINDTIIYKKKQYFKNRVKIKYDDASFSSNTKMHILKVSDEKLDGYLFDTDLEKIDKPWWKIW